MQMSSKAGRRTFLIVGIISLINSLIISFASLSVGEFFVGYELVFLGTTVMTFCLAYLYPQFKENDERSKRIKEKGMFFSYFFILGYMAILMPLLQFEVVNLNGYQTVCLLTTLTIITVFSSFVVLSKRY
ncbi:uncharacterized membrane protein HdeD (DUF308 family) [Bacillus mesophilus]|uniref:Permease n=1 Tax=Bacillus mesophilus TaxID=1808955 RepID=A0A6M0Q620_9BACI|nr:hypothetical protein [Bacillus mesophilus]MBM7660232.1 uncharacterized membrane protein HdeD (DUF308 family) [Bacillus mesophilus]NEY70950.1 hypothetical protein [Bacillus mesophilus]